MLETLTRKLAQQVPARYLKSDLLDLSEEQQIQLTNLLYSLDNADYSRQILKLLIMQSEAQGHLIADQIYEHYSTLMVSGVAQSGKSGILKYGQGDSQVSIKEQPLTLFQEGSTGRRTWEAAVALSSFLVDSPEIFNHLPVLELGGGTGLVGILISKLQLTKRILITDGDPNMVRTIGENIDLNGLKAEATQLLWGSESGNELIKTYGPCWVIAADVTYDSDLFPQLIDSLILEAPRVLVSCTIRSKETSDEFNSQIEARGYYLVQLKAYPSGGGLLSMGFIYPETPEIVIFQIKKKDS